MAKKTTLDRKALLSKLPPVKFDKGADQSGSFLEKMSLDKALLALLKIDHEQEFELCKALANHVLGEVPEPDDFGMEDE